MQPQYTPSSIPTKQCTKCGEHKPATAEHFYTRKGSKDGLRKDCKVCVAARGLKYYEANRDDVIARARNYYQEINRKGRKYYKANRAKVAAQEQRYYTANREKIIARTSKYQKANPDKKAAINGKYRKANKGKIAAYNSKYHKTKPSVRKSAKQRHKARKRNLPNTLTAEQWQACLEYFGGCCAACGRPPGLFHTLAMDHFVPLSSSQCPGTTAGNIIPLCHGEDGCNNSKGKKNALKWAIRKLGKRKGEQFVARVLAYFDAMAS